MIMNKIEIGGYFHLELSRKKKDFIHDDGVLLNSGRNALEYVLSSKKIERLWIPYYTCDTILEPLIKLNIDYSFYSINQQLELYELKRLSSGEFILYTNYFGVKDEYVKSLSEVYGDRLIVDNAQAFYSDVTAGPSYIYSPRKFVGVPDGGIAYSDLTYLDSQLEMDISFSRCSHLLRRYDEKASNGYNDFRENSKLLSMQPMKTMSQLTRALLFSIDFEQIKEIRLRNFSYLHNNLYLTNLLDLNMAFSCPMVYPYYTENTLEIRNRLLANKIYVATYWPNIFQWCTTCDLEYQLANKILPLPIDQRYGFREMDIILSVIAG